VAMENMCRQYFYNYDMDILIPRLFITLGINHPPTTFVQNATRQFALVKLGKLEVIKLGNLDSERDFTDVRDCVRGLNLLQMMGKSGESYNICSGISRPLYQVLDILKKISGLDPKIILDSNLLRPSDEPKLTGDNTKIRELGWELKIPFEQTIEDIYNNWLIREA
jgi:GDP-4-dehydro-6-deoxy-D-mannose reductase